MIEIQILHSCDYQKTLEIQQSRQQEVIQSLQQECIYIVEHPPVITLGRRGGITQLHTSNKTETMVEIIRTERGGLATCHNYGQLVIYPIINIQSRNIGIQAFICLLLQSVQTVLEERYQIHVDISSKNTGIWLDNKKIGSIGMKITNGVSYHGLSLNVYNDLDLFGQIEPCGFSSSIISNLRTLITSVPTQKILPQCSSELMILGKSISTKMIEKIELETF